MKQWLSETKHSMKMLAGCVALVLVTVVVALTANARVLLFIVPCMIMMGAMLWMMMGGRGGRTRGEEK